jgi:Uma2 family endonuclease
LFSIDPRAARVWNVIDRVTKRALYARAGIGHYWLIDPDARVLEALALRDGVWVEVGVYDEHATHRIAPFEAIEIPVGRLFLPKEADEIRQE